MKATAASIIFIAAPRMAMAIDRKKAWIKRSIA